MAHIRDPFLHEFENMSRNRSFPKAMLACSASRSLCSKWPGVVEQWEEPKTQSPKLPKLSSEATEEAPAEASEEAPAEQPAPPEAVQKEDGTGAYLYIGLFTVLSRGFWRAQGLEV